MSLHHARYLRSTTILALLVLLLLPSLSLAADTPPPACNGNFYTVRAGDTWSILARRTGVSVAELKRLNPSAVRPSNWLWIGDRLCIPIPETTPGNWYEVKPGDTWNTVARATGVPVRELWRANPALVDRLYWLYIGQRVWIPVPPPTVAIPSAPEVKTAPAAAASVAPAASMTPSVSAAPAVGVTPSPTPSVPAIPPGCAVDLAGYPDLILAYLNKSENTPDGLKAWLAECGAITADPDAVTLAAIRSEGSADLIVVLHDPTLPPPEGSGVLLVYHSDATGYRLAHKVESTGSIALLTVGDLNLDKQPDIIWADTTCGLHTCLTALHVDSWDGTAYADWITGEPTIASAEYRFADVTPDGSGEEIIVTTGVIDSEGAGPQRARSETYISPGGGPYTLYKQVYAPSTCLYHTILDANAALVEWVTEGFDAAIALYTEAIENQQLTACGSIADELATLRDFARLRLMIAQYGAGRPAAAQATIAQITVPGLRGAASAFLDAYKSSGSIIQACRDTGVYAQANPASWQFLADWGYANPSFTAEDLCPLK